MSLPYLIEKEFKQMMRNWILPVVFVLLPVAMITRIIPCLTQDVSDVRLCVVDADHSTTSARLINKLGASTTFSLVANVHTHKEALAMIDADEADIALEIANDFERSLVRTSHTDISLHANSVNGTKGALAIAYATQVIYDYVEELREESGTLANTSGAGTRSMQNAISTHYLYNPTLDYKTYMLPGLMGMILVLLVGFLPALNIVGEKENDTLEQINVTPISKTSFIFSKLIPYWVVGLFVFAFSAILGAIVHGVTPRGSVWTLFVFISLFTLVVSSLGLIVSNTSETMQQAALVMFFFLVVFLLLSGLLTPVTSMPTWAQYITYLNPFRWFMEAARAIYIKGSGIYELLRPLYALTAMAIVLFPLSLITYRKSKG